MNSTVKQLKEIPGVASCVLEHEVTKTKASFKWEGPKISPELWNQVLAFLKWTYDEHTSESQVRLYVNTTAGIWGAYAHPQEAKTGMTAKTFDIKETPEDTIQRCRLMGDEDPAHWRMWGTVHGHCNAPAFQSSVDAADESKNTGLHITIGKLGEKFFDLHSRVSIGSFFIEPQMQWFWDVEPYFEEIPKHMRYLLVDGVENRIARMQMCTPPPAETEIPSEWKENVIEVKPSYTGTGGGLGYRGIGFGNDDHREEDWEPPKYYKSHKTPANIKRDLWMARKELLDYFENTTDDQEKKADVIATLQNLKDWPYLEELLEILYRNDVSLERLTEFMLDVEEKQAEREAEKKQKAKKGKKADKQDNGVPDYKGDKLETTDEMQERIRREVETEHPTIPGDTHLNLFGHSEQ